jgi:hypothetical protein
MSAADLRKELRELRKEHVKPVSRMRKGDISNEISKLREMRETTPAPAAVPSSVAKVQKSAVESVKEAKKKEFPVTPGEQPKKEVKNPKATSKKPKDVVSKAVKFSKAQMMEMLSKMSDD